MNFRRSFFTTLTAATVVIVMVLTSVSVSSGASPERISIACSKDLAPFHFSDDSGQPAGIMIDIWRLWSEKSGIAVDFQVADWNETLTMVGSGKADVHAGLFYNKERDKFLDYGLEFMKMETHYFWHVSLPSIKEIDDLAPYRVGVIDGDYVESYLKERLPEGNVVPFVNYHAMMNALQEGTLKVFAADTLPALYYLDKSGLLSSFTFDSEKPLYKNSLFFAVKDGNQALIETIHQGMALITDEEKRDINRRWITTGDGKGDAVIISIDRAYEPFTFVNALGQPSGFFVDVWRLWSEKTGRKIQFRASGWMETLEGLRAGEADIHSGLSFSEERSEWIDFSTQIYETYTRVYQRAGNKKPAAIDDYEDDVVGTQFGTYQDVEFKKAYPNLGVRNYGSNQELIDALLKGEIKAIVQEEVLMEADLDRLGLHGAITAALTERLFPSTIHAGVIKGNAELLEQINSGFAAIDREKLADLEQRWIHNPEDHFYKSDTASIVLSPEEKSWLSIHPKVVFWFSDLFKAPGLIISETGEYSGYLWDMLQLVKQQLVKQHADIEFELKIATNDEIITLNQKGQVDGYLSADVNTYPKFGLLATDSYLSVHPVFFSNSHAASRINGYDDLSGRRVAVVVGHNFILSLLKNKVPNTVVEEFPDLLSALGAVIDGTVDVYAGFSTANYMIEKYLLSDVKTAFMDQSSPAQLGYGVRKEWPELVSILNKAISSIPENEIVKIRHHWLETKTSRIELTPKEAAWLKEHQEFKLGIDPFWAPFEFIDEHGEYSGISSGYVEAIADRLQVEMYPIIGFTWSQAVEMAKAGEIDVISAMVPSSDREKYLNFSEPYISVPIIIAVHEKMSHANDLNDLAGNKIGVVEDYFTEETLTKNYPDLKLTKFSTLKEGLKDLDEGKLDAFVDSLGAITHEIALSNLRDIKISAPTEYKFDLAFGVRKDWPELVSILNKAIDDISDQERKLIKNTWMAPVAIKYGLDLKRILMWAVPIGISIVLIILFGFVWNRRLTKEVGQRIKAEAELKIDEERLEALLRLSQIKDVDEEQLIDYALEECVRLTSSQVGYIHFVKPDQKTLSLYTWSKNTHKYCEAEKKPHYPIEEAGIWADSVRTRVPVIHNDYQNHPDRKDLPDGHVPLSRHMSIPVLDADKVLMVIGVGNKESPYTDSDIRQLTLFMNSMWGIIKEKRAEEIRTRYEFVVNSVKDPMSFINKNYVYEAVNESLSNIFQDTPKNLIGKTVAEVWGSGVFEEFIQPSLDRCFTGEVVSYEALVDLEKLGNRHCEITMYPYFNEKKKVTHVVVVTKDIEDRIKGEEELRRNMEELEEFNEMAIGREERMIELKEEINGLLDQIGKDKKYEIVE